MSTPFTYYAIVNEEMGERLAEVEHSRYCWFDTMWGPGDLFESRLRAEALREEYGGRVLLLEGHERPLGLRWEANRSRGTREQEWLLDGNQDVVGGTVFPHGQGTDDWAGLFRGRALGSFPTIELAKAAVEAAQRAEWT